jgi:hypothetical protein
MEINCKRKADLFCLDFVKERILDEKELSLPVATDSMLPFISPADRLVIKTCMASDVMPGNIVLFERGSTLIVHRLHDKKTWNEELLLLPKADRDYIAEEPFSAEQLLGRVVKIHKKSITVHLDKWHGRAINQFFYLYALFKMNAYAAMSAFKKDLQRDTRKEDILMRLCSATIISKNAAADIREILGQDVDWDYFLKKVQGEDTASLIYKTLFQIEEANVMVPRHIKDQLKDFYYAVLASNISLFQSIEKVALSFKKDHIDAIVFKGLMLAGSVYKDIGLRPMGDVDLLLKRKDVARADQVLRRNGFHPEFELKDFENLSSGQYRNSLVYRSADSVPVSVHIHWHVVNFSPFHKSVLQKINLDRVWHESTPLHIGKAEMRTFSLYHQIIFLSMHAVNHSFHPLVRLCDISELLRAEKDEIDWERLVNEAFAFNLSKSVYYVLYLLSEMFDVEIPQAVLHRLRPRRVGMIERTFLSSVLAGTPILTGEWLICFGMNETLKDRFLFLWELLFPPQKELAIIQKRDNDRAGLFDYLKRLTAGIRCALKVILNFTRQAAFKF